MSRPRTTRFPLQVRGDGTPDAEEWEELAQALRTELLDVGATSVEQVPSEPAPPDARGLVSDIAGVMNLVVTASQTADVLARIVRAVQRWRAARARRVTLEVAGVELGGDESAVRRIVDRLLGAADHAGADGDVGVRRALVIANRRYDDTALRGLRAPADDARALDRVLGDPDIGSFDVDLCLDENESAIRRRIADFFADRDRDDLLLLHYSGHGVKDGRGRLFLAARDTDLRRLSATAIPASFLNDQMTESASRRVVLVLDCCYSGAFARGAVVRADRAVHVAEEFGGQGRVVLTASSATEYAFEGGELLESDARPSVFTSALVRGLETGAADLDTDGEITIDELYDYTYREVRRDQPEQAPMKWIFGVEGSLVLARSIRGAQLPRPVLDDLSSSRIGLRLEAVDELRHLLRSGKPAVRDAARHALDNLSAHDDSNRVRTAATQALTDHVAAATGPDTAPPPSGTKPSGPRTAPPPSLSPEPAAKAESKPKPAVEPAPGPAPEPGAGPAPVPAAEPATETAPEPAPEPAAEPARTSESAPKPEPAPAPVQRRRPERRDETPPISPAPHEPQPRRGWLPRTRRGRLIVAGAAAVLLAATTVAIVQNQIGDGGSDRPSEGGASAAPSVFALAFSPDGKTLASGHTAGAQTVRLWDVATGRPASRSRSGSPGVVFDVAFSPDGRTLASAGEDGQVRFWDPATGQAGRTLAHTGQVHGVAFSPDGRTLASAGWSGVRLWDTATGQPSAQSPTSDFAALGVAFSPDGGTLAAASGDDTVRLLNARTGQPVGRPLTGHTRDVTAVAFSPDGKVLASASLDHSVRLWNPATGQPIGQPLAGHTDSVQSVAFSPDGTLLASGGHDGTIRLWNPADGQPAAQLLDPQQRTFDDILAVAFSPDGKVLGGGRAFGTVQLWNPATRLPTGTVPRTNTPSVSPSPTPS